VFAFAITTMRDSSKVFAVFVLLYVHAWRKREELELNAEEPRQTIERLGANSCFVAIGVLSLAVALFGGPQSAGWAGLVYMLIAPVITVYYTLMGRRRRVA
jgi:hypothetical protein